MHAQINSRVRNARKRNGGRNGLRSAPDRREYAAMMCLIARAMNDPCALRLHRRNARLHNRSIATLADIRNDLE